MAARPMFRGLAFVVFLSVVNPVWMVVTTDLSTCNVTNISPQDVFLQDLTGSINFYVTGQTRGLYLNEAVAELITFTMDKTGTLTGAVSVMFLNGTQRLCTDMSSIVTINKSMKRMEIGIANDTKMHCYLINSNVQFGHFAWFCQILKYQVPIGAYKFFSLWAVDPLLPPSPDMVKVAFGKMCSGLQYKSDMFNSYSAETLMTKDCRFLSPTLVFHSTSTSSAVQTMPSVFLSMTLSLLVLYL